MMDWRPILDKHLDNSTFEGGVLLKNGQQLLGPIRKSEFGTYVIRLIPRDKMGDPIPDAPAIDSHFDPEDVILFQELVRESGIIRPKFDLSAKFDPSLKRR